MSFATLVVIVLAGLGGPLAGLWGGFVPVAIGELAAGVLVGPAVIGAVDPSGATVSFLGEVGFAMLMLTVGMHLPLREPRIGLALRRGATLAGIVALLSVPAGLLAAALAGTGHAAVYAVVLASGSAAVLLPALQELGLDSEQAVTAMAQVTIADLLTVLAVPIALRPSSTGRALLGTVLVAAAVALLLAGSRLLADSQLVRRARKLSKQRHWALDLRLALAVLFLLAWIAVESGTSVLVAGFGAGLMVALIGGPKRLSTQVRGVADGFFVPLYFVVLGARLDVGGLFEHPAMLALAAGLLALTLLLRLAASVLVRAPLAGALAACGQLGVPAAAASIGLAEHVLSPGVATAIVAAALGSLGICTVGVQMLMRPDEDSPAGTGKAPGSAPQPSG